MSGPIDLEALVEQLDELYRPSPRGHWQRRVQRLISDWLGRPDVELRWSPASASPAPVQIGLPGRSAPPRALRFRHRLTREEETLARALAPHVAMVAELMERRTAPWSRTLPPRWRQRLTRRQAEVAVLVASGFSNEDVATMLGNAPRTVARLMQEIFQRLDISSRTELAAETALGRPPTPFEQMLHRAELDK